MEAGDQILHTDSKSGISWTGPHLRGLSMYRKNRGFLGMGYENFPFLFVYPYILSLCYQTFGDPYAQRLLELQLEWGDDFQTKLENEEFLLPNPYLPGLYPLLLLFIAGGLHILMHLFQEWFMSVRLFFKYSSCSSVRQATHFCCVPHPHRGKQELVPIRRFLGVVSFEFQRHRYILDEVSETTFELVFADNHLPLGVFYNSKGLNSNQVSETLERFGKNVCNIPLPTFSHMYREQLLQPITVFQVFCTLLWLLDEYWRYSLFSGLMIFIFEATTVYQRLRNLKSLRGMAAPPTSVQVLRNESWTTCQTSDLLVGDRFRLEAADIPCDCILVTGSAVVNEASLTGESHPQLKEAISSDSEALKEILDLDGSHKVHVLFGGTQLVQGEGSEAVVLQTGFGSSQGRLVQMIEYSNQSVSGDWRDALLLVLFLSLFAVVSASYVLKESLAQPEDKRKSTFELLLHCVMIVTSVIPPELPMQTAMAVNSALAALAKLHVFCTEPFRIPLAGKVNLCLFDKTGTLTSDKLTAIGVFSGNRLHDLKDAPEGARKVLGGCHSLVQVNEKAVGDPIEESAFEAMGYQIVNDTFKSPSGDHCMKIKQRFHFTSSLQRMSAVVENKGVFTSLVKGSPEALEPLLRQVPADYWEGYRSLTRQGMRVLALASKTVKSVPLDSRASAESDLEFHGFAAFRCLVRKDSKRLLEELINAAHKVIMVTGDALLTAVHVADEVGVLPLPPALLVEVEGNSVRWESSDGTVLGDFDAFSTLKASHSLCVSGTVLELLGEEKWVQLPLSELKVLARMTPALKERVVALLQEDGHVCLFCGDGANDVGALKQSFVGVALLSGFGDLNAAQESSSAEQDAAERLENKKRRIAERKQNMLDKQQRIQQDAKERAERGESWAWFNAVKAFAEQEAKEARERSKGVVKGAALDEYLEAGESDVPSIKLGDASLAAPFTAKTPSIQSVVDVIRRGRTALVQTLQMYQVLALNCLISSYSLSVLYLDGIKYGDRQMTASGILITFAFLALSRAAPLPVLASVRPPTSIFHPSLFLSILGQFAVHLVTMMMARGLALSHPLYEPQPGKEFVPNLLNTVVFLVSTTQSVCVFLTNYKGKPFMQSIADNPGLLYSLGACALMVFLSASETFPPLNTLLQLVPFPDSSFSKSIFMLLVVDVIGCLLWNLACSAVFSPSIFWASVSSASRKDITKLVQMAFVLGMLVHFFMPDEETLEQLAKEGLFDNTI